MGFLSKIRNRVKAQIQPGNMFARDMGPGNMPKRPDIFGRDSFLFGRRPRGNMGFDFRMPQKRGGGFGNLREAIRKLQEKRGGDMGMPSMPGIDFGDQIGYKRPNKNPDVIAFDNPSFRMIGTPQPIPERMPTDPSSYFNPTIFGQQMGDMDFSQMPEISPVDMSELNNLPRDFTAPREISQMNLPQMPEGLPSMQDVQGGRSFDFADYKPQDRMMMAEGDEVINRSPEQEIFSLQSQLKNLEEQLRMDRSYNDDQAVIDTSAQMAAIQRRIRELLQESGQTISNTDRAQLSGGGDFPDLTGDGKVTQADILKGRGVKMMYGGEMKGYANGGEIEGMLSGMESPMGEEEAMAELEQVQPEMEMIEQLVMMVTQMIQQGASEEEVIMFLREQGLDDEDIGTVLQLVAEMSETEEMAEDQIGNELAQLG